MLVNIYPFGEDERTILEVGGQVPKKVGLVAQPLTGGALTVLTVLTVLGKGGSDGVTSDEAGL